MTLFNLNWIESIDLHGPSGPGDPMPRVDALEPWIRRVFFSIRVPPCPREPLNDSKGASMDDQLSFASLDFAAKKKRTKRDVFLAEMAAVVPWDALEALIAPHYPKPGPQGGRRPFPLPTMLRIYCLQQWYALSDPGAEEALYDIQSMRAFAGLELGHDAIPDETYFGMKAHIGVDARSGLRCSCCSRSPTCISPAAASRPLEGEAAKGASPDAPSGEDRPRNRPSDH